MDRQQVEKLLGMMASDSDSDAVMALRSLQGLLKSEGVDMGRIFDLALANLDTLKKQSLTIESALTPAKKANAPVEISGMPQCRSPQPGSIELIAPGHSKGEIVHLAGEAAAHADMIAEGLKDALLAAVINKSRFKLKLFDVKNVKGETVETALQAEYEREGMAPIRVWANVRGEVATVAAVLRKAVANTFPELAAA